MSATVVAPGGVEVAIIELIILVLAVLSMLKMETVQPKASQDPATECQRFTFISTVTFPFTPTLGFGLAVAMLC
jgi:hypothetical protein